MRRRILFTNVFASALATLLPWRKAEAAIPGTVTITITKELAEALAIYQCKPTVEGWMVARVFDRMMHMDCDDYQKAHGKPATLPEIFRQGVLAEYQRDMPWVGPGAVCIWDVPTTPTIPHR